VTSGASIEQHFSFDKHRFRKKCDKANFVCRTLRDHRESVAKKWRFKNLMTNSLSHLAMRRQNLLAGT